MDTRLQVLLQELQSVINDSEIGLNLAAVSSSFRTWKASATNFVREIKGNESALEFSMLIAPDTIKAKQAKLILEAKACYNYLQSLSIDKQGVEKEILQQGKYKQIPNSIELEKAVSNQCFDESYKNQKIAGAVPSLQKLSNTLPQTTIYYIENFQNQGEFVMSQDKGNVKISGVQGNISGVAAAGEDQSMKGVAFGTISGSVSNTIDLLPASSSPNQSGIKELLTQLQAAIETESELSDEDKAEALEQVKTLAKAGVKPEDNALQKAAKTSMKILKGTIATLPDTAKLIESCAKLLPAIAALLALV